MSTAADYLRVAGLQQQARARMREAHALWLTAGVAYGMGGYPPAGIGDRLDQAVSEAERLTLEWQTAL